MRKILLIICFFLISISVSPQKSKLDYNINIQIGSEIRFPLLKLENRNISPESLNPSGFIFIYDNKDIYEYLDADALYYKLNFRIYKSWFCGFQHSLRYAHVGFLEKNKQNQFYFKYGESLNQLVSDYKIFFKKKFKIKKSLFDVSFGYNFMGFGTQYFLNNPSFMTSLSRLTAFDISNSFHYKFFSLGWGLYVIDDSSFISVINNFNENNSGFGNFIFYMNLSVDLIRF